MYCPSGTNWCLLDCRPILPHRGVKERFSLSSRQWSHNKAPSYSTEKKIKSLFRVPPCLFKLQQKEWRLSTIPRSREVSRTFSHKLGAATLPHLPMHTHMYMYTYTYAFEEGVESRFHLFWKEDEWQCCGGQDHLLLSHDIFWKCPAVWIPRGQSCPWRSPGSGNAPLNVCAYIFLLVSSVYPLLG